MKKPFVKISCCISYAVILSGMIFFISGCALGKGRREWKAFNEEAGKMLFLNNEEAAVTYPKDQAGVEEYIRIALLNNPGLKSAFYDWKAALKKVPQATSLDDPQFTYSWYIEEVETRVGAQEQAFNIMQKFPFLGKLEARGDAAIAKANQMRAKYEAKKLNLVYEVKDSYHEYAYLSKAIRITAENQQLLENFEKVAQIKYKTGEAQNADLLKAQVELGKIANDLITLKDFKKPVQARLNASLNIPSDCELPFPTNVNYSDSTVYDRQTLIDKFHKNNPQLKQRRFEVDEAKTKVLLSRLDFLPDVSVGATYIDTEARSGMVIPGNGEDPVILMFKVNVPIWYNRLFASLDEAKSYQSARQYSLKNQTNTLMTRIENVLYKWEDAKRQAALYGDALISKAQQSLKAAETDYRSGKRDFLGLIDSQRMLLAFNLTYLRAQSNAAQRLAELEMLLGGVFDKDN